MTTATTIGPVQLLGASFFSTHHASAEDALAGRERDVAPPAYKLLVGRARRFTSLVTQMHVEVCGALQIDPTGLRPAPQAKPVGSPPHDSLSLLDPAAPPLAVFATCHGEIQTAEKLIADFREAAMVSSARFALSVHNTPSGVYSVATGSSAPSTTVTGANAIAAGWLEAVLTALDAGRPVLLSIADEPVPAVFQGPAELAGVAAAFLLGPGASSDVPGGRRARLAITPSTPAEEPSPLQVLARAADAWMREEPATISLGHLQPGAALELRFLARDARA